MYTISWIENKISAKTNAPYAIANLTDDKGANFENVTIFGNYPGFSDMRPGGKIECELIANDYNGKKGWKAQRRTVAPAWATKGPSGIKAAQERKEVMIEKAQERKSESIAYFNAVNSAIALIGPQILEASKNGHEWSKYKDAIIEARDWFLSEWEKYNAKPPF